MGKVFWMGIWVMLAMMGTAKAQSVPLNDTMNWTGAEIRGGVVPTECPSDGPPCTFRCREGDLLRIRGYAETPGFGRAWITVRASCGGVAVECSADSRETDSLLFESARCRAQSEPTAFADQGVCTAEGERFIYFYCRSITLEEAAELDTSGKSRVIKIPPEE